MMVLAFFAVPFGVMGALYADVRLGPALALLVIAAFDIRVGAPILIDRFLWCRGIAGGGAGGRSGTGMATV